MAKCSKCGHIKEILSADLKDKEVTEIRIEPFENKEFVNIWITAKSSTATDASNLVLSSEGVAKLEEAIAKFKRIYSKSLFVETLETEQV